MADSKMAIVAFLLLSLVVASTVPPTSALCFPDCYDRCANGQVGNTPCATMCAQACIVPKTLPDGSDPAKLFPGGKP